MECKNNMRTVRFKLIRPTAFPPERAHDSPYSDAGYDLRSCTRVVLQPGETAAVDVGIAIELPRDTWFHVWEAQLRSRSSLRKQGIIASFGTIDSGFRGEIGCILHNLTESKFTIYPGDKICQLVINKLPKIRWELVEELNTTSRGHGRYGSTGK